MDSRFDGFYVITKNAAKCHICGEIVESVYRHDFITCGCGSLSVDGGKDYLKRCFKDATMYEEVSEGRYISAQEALARKEKIQARTWYKDSIPKDLSLIDEYISIVEKNDV